MIASTITAPPPTQARASGRRRRRRRPRGRLLGLTMALPALLLLGMFILWPIGTSVYYSTTSASGYGDVAPAGGANYARAIGDPALYAAFGRNVIFAVVVVIASIVIGFVLAYLLYLRVGGWRPLQILFMVPYVMPVVVTALLWQFILQPDNGLLNTALRALHLDALAGLWLSGESTALGSVSLVQIWVLVPFAMLLIFGAMVSLPGETLEAADLDGAGHIRKMVQVVLPMIRPTVSLTAIVIAVQLFRSFDLVYLLTKGGPIDSTTIATLYVFVQGFVDNDYGYANAVGILIGLVLVALAVVPQLIARASARRSTHEEKPE